MVGLVGGNRLKKKENTLFIMLQDTMLTKKKKKTQNIKKQIQATTVTEET